MTVQSKQEEDYSQAENSWQAGREAELGTGLLLAESGAPVGWSITDGKWISINQPVADYAQPRSRTQPLAVKPETCGTAAELL